MTRTLVGAAALIVLATALSACDSGEKSTESPASAATTSSVAPTTIRKEDSRSVQPEIDPGDDGDYHPMLDPKSFVDVVDNPYLPLYPGSRWVYEGTDGGVAERIEVTVTAERKDVMGIAATVVRDTVFRDGEMVEDTLDWFAQDGEGNVWYLGEETAEYEGGEIVNTDGSWEAGIDGALPGIAMPANPAVGHAYRQEFLSGEAEDMGEVVRIAEQATTPAGGFEDVIVTKDWTPLDPGPVEEKYYARGVGLILEIHIAGGDSLVQLIEFAPGL